MLTFTVALSVGTMVGGLLVSGSAPISGYAYAGLAIFAGALPMRTTKT